MALPDPIFITTDPNQIVADLIAFYETETGLSLSPAQVERMLINAWAYREALLRSGVNEAAKQNLVAFAIGVILDYLAQLVGVTRLPEQPAETTIEFTLVPGHGAVVIPLGTRVASTDGKAVFYTLVATPVSIGVDTAEILCRCETPGIIGNGYIAGAVSVILDPQAYLDTAENTDTTVGGIQTETDEQLRLRIYLAPASYSTAGSEDGYKFYARSASQSIIDVSVFSSAPGVVDIYPLTMESGGTPAEILADVEAAVTGEKVRPLNDDVNVISPSEVTYSIDIDLTLFAAADQTETEALVQAAAQAYADAKRKQLGRDIIIDQLKALVVIPDAVYSLVVNQPAADVILDQSEYPECTGITINVVGLNNG